MGAGRFMIMFLSYSSYTTPLPPALSLSKHSQVRHHSQPPAWPCCSPGHCDTRSGRVHFISDKTSQHRGVSTLSQLVHPYHRRYIQRQGGVCVCCGWGGWASLISWETLFVFCSKGILQSLDYVKNLQNVPGRRGFKGENVNPLFRCNNTITTSGIATETWEEEAILAADMMMWRSIWDLR